MSNNKLEQQINYIFKNKNLLTLALTHPSYVHKNQSPHSLETNQRLEFLGDAVLDLCVSEYLYLKFPEIYEGEMSLIRSKAVCEAALFVVATDIGLGEHILLGRGEKANGGNQKPSVLSDAVESLIGAIFLDGGIEAAKTFINSFAPKSIEKLTSSNSSVKDFKTLLQEKVQKNGTTQIKYNLLEESGPDHNKTFSVEVIIRSKSYGKGIGKNKKIAEQNAAQEALENWREE